MYFSTAIRIITLSLFIFAHSIQANSTDKSFAIKGAGAVSCKHYLGSVKAKGAEYIAFSGWIDGYLTAANQFQPETFDLAPWQSTLLLSKALEHHCQKYPDISFFKAMSSMTHALYRKRLKNRSEVMKIQRGNQSLLLYKDIIKRIQAALNEKTGTSLTVDGIFNRQTESALKKFQQEQKKPVTGIPDQTTLQKLFR